MVVLLRVYRVEIRIIRRWMCFFFQAEDGIRDVAVTGVQTCALPIVPREWESPRSSTVCWGVTSRKSSRCANPTAGDGTPRPRGNCLPYQAARCSWTRRGCANCSSGTQTKESPKLLRKSRRLRRAAGSPIAPTEESRGARCKRPSKQVRSIWGGSKTGGKFNANWNFSSARSTQKQDKTKGSESNGSCAAYGKCIVIGKSAKRDTLAAGQGSRRDPKKARNRAENGDRKSTRL